MIKRPLFNVLGPITHLLAGLILLAWLSALERVTPNVSLVVAVSLATLLPDIDSPTSILGRLFAPLATTIEQRFGQRTVTHSLLALALFSGLCWSLSSAPNWWLIAAAYGSHLLIDMIVGVDGIALFWPARLRCQLIQVKARSWGELIVALICALIVIYPFIKPQAVSATARTTPLPPTASIAPTPSREPVVIRIDHVYDPAAEILIRRGDWVTRGQLIADLVTYRTFNSPPVISTSNIPSPTPILIPTPASTPTALPTISIAWEPNPIAIAKAEANLALAVAEATRAARPPGTDEIRAVCNRTEQLRRELWRNQIARDMAKAQAIAWEAIHVLEIDLDILEGDIAAADAECAAFKARAHRSDAYDLAVAAARLQVAEIAYLEVLTPPTPSPTLQPTQTALLPPTPTAKASPTPVQLIEDVSQIRSLITGYVADVRIVAINGNEATIEIDILTDGETF